MIKDILNPRVDVLAGKLQGVIDLERVSDPRGRALEARIKDFFAATYASGEIRKLITGLDTRLHSESAETGLFLAEGHKGEGKSHALLVALHLLRHAGDLQEWLRERDLTFSPPAGTRVIWRKFTDFPLESLWGVIADELTLSFPNDRPPSIDEFRAALGEGKLVLIFDELESGIRAIANPALQQQNLNFLQMLSEEANREGSRIAILASIYDGSIEPGLTLKRVARIELRFQDVTDRRKVLFHRLFERSPLDPSPEIDAVVQSHGNAWRRFGVSVPPDYADDFRSSYPFLPEVLEVVLERIRAIRGGFQGTRGALGFLAALVRVRCESGHLISLADAGLSDREMRSWLADLDPAQNLLACAEANLRELRKNPFAEQIASAVVLASLAPSPKEPGLTEDELARQLIGPESDYNAFLLSLTNFKKFGSFFHERGGSLYFDAKENAHAKVNLRSLSVSDEEAWDRLAYWWATDILRDANLVVFSDVDATRQAVESQMNNDVRIIAAPRRLAELDVHSLYFGLGQRNTVLLIEPRDDKINLRINDSLLAYAKRWIAADNLARTAGDSARSAEFSKIGAEDKRHAVDYLRKTSFVYVQILQYGATVDELEIQRENLPAAATREQIIQHLARNIYPPTLIQEHLAERISSFIGRTVSQVEDDYRNTPGFPVITSHSYFLEAVSALVEQGDVLGLKHSAGDQCGKRPSLTSAQLAEAVISEPFEKVGGGPVLSQSAKENERAVRIDAESGALLTGLEGTEPAMASGGQSVSTSFLATRQQVRQEVARILEENDGKEVGSLLVAITYDKRRTDIAALPSFVRGTLTGSGVFAGEVSLLFEGAYSKAQIEEMVERLPDFTPGACRVTLLLRAAGAEEAGT